MARAMVYEAAKLMHKQSPLYRLAAGSYHEQSPQQLLASPKASVATAGKPSLSSLYRNPLYL